MKPGTVHMLDKHLAPHSVWHIWGAVMPSLGVAGVYIEIMIRFPNVQKEITSPAMP